MTSFIVFGQAVDVAFPIDINGVVPSSSCWQLATDFFPMEKSIDTGDFDPRSFCNTAPDSFHQMLALQITKCHMITVDKALYTQEAIEMCHNGLDNSNLEYCLKRLTDEGINTFTVYITYVQSLCLRLTQQRMLKYTKDIHLEISKRNADLVINNVKVQEAMKEALMQHLTVLNEVLIMPEKILQELSNSTNHYSEGLAKSLKGVFESHVETMMAGLVENISTIVANQFESQFERSLRDFETRFKDSDEQFQKTQDHKKNVFLHQLNDTSQYFKSQVALLKEHYEFILKSTDAVNVMFSLSSYLPYFSNMSFAIEVVQLFLSILFRANSIRFLTMVSSYTGTELDSILQAVLVLQLMSEAIIYASAKVGIISEDNRESYAKIIRKNSFLMIVYVAISAWIMLNAVPFIKSTYRNCKNIFKRTVLNWNNNDDVDVVGIKNIDTGLSSLTSYDVDPTPAPDKNSFHKLQEQDENRSQSSKLSYISTHKQRANNVKNRKPNF